MTALERAIEEQKRYYDLRASDYLTDAPSDRRQRNRDPRVEAKLWRSIIDELRPRGRVLELACGPGCFTRELARHAESVTAVDASPQMLARNRAEVARPHVRYIEADIFGFETGREFDVVFFGFFLSHVPPAAFETFWSIVRGGLRPGGRVAFVDEDDRAVGYDDVRVQDGVPCARRTLRDGREFDVVKVFWHPDDLTARLSALGWHVTISRVGADLLSGIASYDV
jgi:SAM-dependent methyltransferase